MIPSKKLILTVSSLAWDTCCAAEVRKRHGDQAEANALVAYNTTRWSHEQGLMGGPALYCGPRSAYGSYYSDTLYAASPWHGQLEYESGNLEIERDDLEDIPDVHIALYTERRAR